MFDAPPLGVQSEDGTDRHHPSATAGERNCCLNSVQITDVEEKMSDKPVVPQQEASPYSVVCTPVAKRLWEGGSRDGGGGSGGGGGASMRKAARYSSSLSSSLSNNNNNPDASGRGPVPTSTGVGGGTTVGAAGLNSNHNHNNNNVNNGGTPEGTSPGTLSMYTSDSPISYHDDEEEDDVADDSAEEQYRQICNMYTMYSMLNASAAGKVPTAHKRIAAVQGHLGTLTPFMLR